MSNLRNLKDNLLLQELPEIDWLTVKERQKALKVCIYSKGDNSYCRRKTLGIDSSTVKEQQRTKGVNYNMHLLVENIEEIWRSRMTNSPIWHTVHNQSKTKTVQI